MLQLHKVLTQPTKLRSDLERVCSPGGDPVVVMGEQEEAGRAMLVMRTVATLAMGSLVFLAGCGAQAHGTPKTAEAVGGNRVSLACVTTLRHSQPLESQAPTSRQPWPALGKVEAQAFPHSVRVGQQTVICGTAWLAGHQPASHYPLNVVGVHQRSSSLFVITTAVLPLPPRGITLDPLPC